MPRSRRLSLSLAVFLALPLAAQGRPTPSGTTPPPAKSASSSTDDDVKVVNDSTITRTGLKATIKGQEISYNVTVGTQPVWDSDNKVVASMFYTYYERQGVGDHSTRPLVISFNGGPGSGSLWMHIAYTGPKILKIDDEGYPVQPYGIQDNPNSILDVADIVYIDPVNTGFSRIVGDAKREQFFGVNEDIAYLARWLQTWVTRHERWTSPKYLIGESYGTTRAAGLAGRLQGSHWMFLNGVILVSPTDLGVARSGPVGDALTLPYYTATAWYHKALSPALQAKTLAQLLPEVEAFTLNEVIPAMAKGGTLPAAERDQLATRYATYSGLSVGAVKQYNLAVPTDFFWKELLRDKGLTIGRLDSRYRGLDREDAGTSPDFDPALVAWNHAFAPAINYYLRDQLGWKTDLEYWLFGPVNPWNRNGERTGQQLQQAMAENPYLNLMVQSGYFDGGTPYFDAKYTMWNIDPSGRFQDRMKWIGYESGHMMYLRKPDLAKANDDIRDFIRTTVPKPGQPARQ
ncbi:MAG: carboxypeptidase [Gemmatimonadota bacterium]